MGITGKTQWAAFLLLVASGAQAESMAVLHNYSSDGTPAWADNPQFMDCGLRCIYLQSVEKISIRSRHTIEKLERMRSIRTGIDSTNDKDKAVIQARAEMDQLIPGMCDWAGSVTGQKESVKECQIRWFKVQIPTLYQDRLAIKYNASSAAELQDGKVTVLSGTATPDPSADADPAKPRMFRNATDDDYIAKQPVVTTMEDYKDVRDRVIRNSYRDPKLANANRLAQEVEKTTGISREEFVLTRQILKDPNDPKAGTYSIVVTNADGTPKYDVEAFNKASRNRMALLALDAQEKARLEANLKQLGKLQREQVTTADAKHKEIYTTVRSSILGTARRALEKDGMIAPSAAPPRAPAATVQGPKPANRAFAAQAQGRQGASDEAVSRDTIGRVGDEKDIQVPARTAAGNRPFFTVGYTDNVLGAEINAIEDGLARQRGNILLER